MKQFNEEKKTFPQELSYGYPDSGPYHLAAPHLHPRYHFPDFIGGVMLITRCVPLPHLNSGGNIINPPL